MKKSILMVSLMIGLMITGWLTWNLTRVSGKEETQPLPDIFVEWHQDYLEISNEIEQIANPEQRQTEQAWAYQKFEVPYLTEAANFYRRQTDVAAGQVTIPPTIDASKYHSFREPDGISENSSWIMGNPTAKGKKLTNFWQKAVGDEAYMVCAGFERELPKQGLVLWARPKVSFIVIYAPRLSGPLRIVEEKDMILRLVSEDGQTFYFDVHIGRFIDDQGHPESIPTLPSIKPYDWPSDIPYPPPSRDGSGSPIREQRPPQLAYPSPANP